MDNVTNQRLRKLPNPHGRQRRRRRPLAPAWRRRPSETLLPTNFSKKYNVYRLWNILNMKNSSSIPKYIPSTVSTIFLNSVILYAMDFLISSKRTVFSQENRRRVKKHKAFHEFLVTKFSTDQCDDPIDQKPIWEGNGAENAAGTLFWKITAERPGTRQ